MYERLKGKKLLVVSSDINDMTFIDAGRELGLYIICCDRYNDWNISPAKLVADEAWNIDYKETEKIAKRCIESGVDGVIAGYGEDRVYAAAQIAKAIGTPFYASEQQIEFTRNKIEFKNKCMECGLLVPHSYIDENGNMDYKLIQLPVIVKPSDNGGRKGITICYTESSLKEAITLAMGYSGNGKIIIEDYIKGIELSAVYTLKDGEYSLSCLNDKYISEDINGLTLCDAVVAPSKFYSRFIKEVDPGIRKLLKSIEARNGVVNFQLIANESGIYPFEMGYRINGNDDYKVIRRQNGIDFVKMLICFSLTGSMGDELARDNPVFSRYSCTLCGYLNSGTIGKISTGNIGEQKNVFDIFFLKSIGFTVMEGHTNAQKAFMVKFNASSRKEIADTITKIQNEIVIEDIKGKNMLMREFDVTRLEY